MAEGAGEFAAADKTRFYRFARPSATESPAIIDALAVLELADEALRTRALLLRHRRRAHRQGLEDLGLGPGLRAPPCPGLGLESLL